MDKVAIRRWRRTVFRVIQSIDKRWKPTDSAFSAAMVMAGIDGFGTDVGVLVELTGFSEPFVGQVLRRLRKSRLVVGQTMRVQWDDTDAFTGSVAFVADALVGAGLVDRTPDPKRSAAAKTRRHSSPSVPRRARVRVAEGAVFTPKRVKSNPLYIGLKQSDASET